MRLVMFLLAGVLLLQGCTTTQQRSRSTTVERDSTAAASAAQREDGAAQAARAPTPLEQLENQVAERERAFARTMADRDLAAFTSFLSRDAVFFSGPEPLRGPDQVTAWWARYFQGEQPPFSWEPAQVEVLDSGTLALITGPVHGPSGEVIGTFNSVWRLEEPGVWRIIFDKGEKACGF